MNRVHALILVFTLAAFCTVATARPVLLVGAKIGPNLANVQTDLYKGAPYKPKPGLIVGGSVEIYGASSSLLPHLGLRLEALYVQKGWKDQVMRTDNSGNELGWGTFGTVHVDELVVSPLLVLRVPVGGVAPYVLAGPEAGFNLSNKEKLASGGTWSDAYHWKKSPNFGLNAGAGIAFKQWIGELSAEVRYNLGLTNMTEANSVFVSKIKTNGLQVFLGYSINVLP
jgi:hypothetical protein